MRSARRAAPAALALALALAVPAPGAPASGARPAKGPEQPSLLFQGFSARASHNGVRLWEARAARARVDHDERHAHGETVTVRYYRRGRVVSRARADHAVIDLKDYDIDASGSVEVRSSEGVVLRTPRLFWDNRAQRISSSAPVTVIRGRMKLTGVGFVADRDLHNVRILSQVRAEALSVRALRKELKSWPGS